MKIKQFEQRLGDIVELLSKANDINTLYTKLLPQMERADVHLSKQMGLTKALDCAGMEMYRISARSSEIPFTSYDVLVAMKDELGLVKARFRALEAFWLISTPYPAGDKNIQDAFGELRLLFEFDDSE